jgi:sugar phosphate isomerase/epimerase
MLALSTSWCSSTLSDGPELVAVVARHGVAGVELDYRIGAKTFGPMPAALKRAGLTVVSVHNFCPHPADMARFSPSGDLLSLSDREKEIRRRAVALTARTLEIAAELEAGVLVLHCGRVAMEPEIPAWQRLFDTDQIRSECGREFAARKLAQRDRLKGPHLDALCFSLDSLLRLAERHGLRLGLENRVHFHELPGPEDFALLFEKFAGAPLGYWHDTGHAQRNAALGICTPQSLLAAGAKHLLGLHLHDARGLTDHLPLGSGEIDFGALKPFLAAGIPRVIELTPGTPEADVTTSIRYCHQNGLA